MADALIGAGEQRLPAAADMHRAIAAWETQLETGARALQHYHMFGPYQWEYTACVPRKCFLPLAAAQRLTNPRLQHAGTTGRPARPRAAGGAHVCRCECGEEAGPSHIPRAPVRVGCRRGAMVGGDGGGRDAGARSGRGSESKCGLRSCGHVWGVGMHRVHFIRPGGTHSPRVTRCQSNASAELLRESVTFLPRWQIAACVVCIFSRRAACPNASHHADHGPEACTGERQGCAGLRRCIWAGRHPRVPRCAYRAAPAGRVSHPCPAPPRCAATATATADYQRHILKSSKAMEELRQSLAASEAPSDAGAQRS